MTTKHGLPMANNRRQEIATIEPEAVKKQPAKYENKHQGTIEKQKLENIKNFGSVLQLAGKIIDIYKINKKTDSDLLLMDAEMKKMTIEASAYVKKLDAKTEQFVVKGQIAVSIIEAISDLINQSNELDANGKLKAIESMTNMVNSILTK